MVKVYSAGGIIFCGEEVLVLTNFRQDVVFPKGHIEPNETPLVAALREVKEEAGIMPAVLADLGETNYSYFVSGRVQHHKTVYWFLMRATDKHLRCDGVEIIRGEYLPVKEALTRLTYDPDREKLSEAARLYLGL